jgi:hypothetical protein
MRFDLCMSTRRLKKRKKWICNICMYEQVLKLNAVSHTTYGAKCTGFEVEVNPFQSPRTLAVILPVRNAAQSVRRPGIEPGTSRVKRLYTAVYGADISHTYFAPKMLEVA